MPHRVGERLSNCAVLSWTDVFVQTRPKPRAWASMSYLGPINGRNTVCDDRHAWRG